jgi:hypothetical protein
MSIEINLDQYQIERKYTRNNKTCYFDPVREIFIQEAPEEIVRQKLLLYLHPHIG